MGLLDNFYKNDFKSFKDDVTSAIYTKINDILGEYKESVAKETFTEEESEDAVSDEMRGDDDDKRGGEFLVDLDFLEGNDTSLKDFRMVGTSKADVINTINNTFGKAKVNIKSVKLNEQRFEKGEDVGKEGLNFKKIAKKAGKQYGSEESGKRVAGSILKKVMAKKDMNESSDEEKPRLKLVKAHTNGNKIAKVYKDMDYNEYRVKFFTDGKHHKDSDGFAEQDKDGLEDAHTQAKNWINKGIR